MTSEHDKKKIAPIIITILAVLYYVLYFSLFIFAVPGIILKLILGIIPLLLAGAMIYVCVQRIREIDGGEEDDLSKY